MVKQKQTPKADAGQNAAAYYERIPSSKDGEFVHADAQVADLNQRTSTEKQRTGEGVAAK